MPGIESLRREIKWLLFDQYGTLVDMQAGLTEAVTPFLRDKGWSGDPRRFVTWWRRTHFENSMIDALCDRGHTSYREIGHLSVAQVMERSGIAHTPDEVAWLVSRIESLKPFPDVVAAQAPILMWLAVAGIIYGAVVAAMQTDLKRLVAYSSVAHMGFVTLGIFSLTHTGMMGGSYQQLSHGISTGALFLLVGLLYERIHTRMFKDMGGLKTRMPIFAALFLLIMLSSVGLPGLNGFVGEFLALLGAFEAGMSGVFGYGIVLPIIAATGVVLAAVYLLWMFQKVFYGRVTNPVVQRLKDLKKWEIAMVGVLVFFAFWGGLYPGTFLKPMEKSIAATRHMALNPVGERPNWEDTSLEIDESGNFVKVAPRSSKVSLEDYAVIKIIAPAGNHFDLQESFEVANLADEEVDH